MGAGGAQGESSDTDRFRTLIGRRVVARYRLATADPATGATLTDAVGELSVAGGTLTVSTSNGEVCIAPSTIVAIKGVPPRPARPGPPHRRLSVLDLELVKAPCWPAREVELLGDWRLRAHGGLTNRANSALVVGDPGLPFPDAVERVRDWYAARDLTPNLALTLEPGAAVADAPAGAAALAARWSERVRSRCLTHAASRAHEAWRGLALPDDLHAEVTDQLSEAWLTSFVGQRGGAVADARALLTGSPAQLFAQVWAGDRLVGRARMAWHDGWASIGGVQVEPSHRRAGLARRMMADLLGQARVRGVESVSLEVELDNEAAAALYAAAGFVAHHDIVNLVAPQGV